MLQLAKVDKRLANFGRWWTRFGQSRPSLAQYPPIWHCPSSTKSGANPVEIGQVGPRIGQAWADVGRIWAVAHRIRPEVDQSWATRVQQRNVYCAALQSVPMQLFPRCEESGLRASPERPLPPCRASPSNTHTPTNELRGRMQDPP